MTVRVGVIGVGVMGADHARQLTTAVSGSAVAGVFDVDRARAHAVAADVDTRVFDDPQELIASREVDAVLIASADATHEQYVLAAMACGKPVLCEKPLAPDVAACERVLHAEQRAGRPLVTVGFMRRFDPGYAALRAAVAGGQLGRPLLMHCVHRNAAAPAGIETSTLITGSAVHEIDAARWLLADEIAEVAVFGPRPSRHAGNVQDPLLLVLTSAQGVVVDLEIFVNAGYGYDVRCELVGESGTLTLDSPAPVLHRGSGQQGRAVPADWRPRFAEAYRRELQDWVGGVARGRPASGATAWDGYAATAVAARAVAALGSGAKEEVSLARRPEFYSR